MVWGIILLTIIAINTAKKETQENEKQGNGWKSPAVTIFLIFFTIAALSSALDCDGKKEHEKQLQQIREREGFKPPYPYR